MNRIPVGSTQGQPLSFASTIPPPWGLFEFDTRESLLHYAACQEHHGPEVSSTTAQWVCIPSPRTTLLVLHHGNPKTWGPQLGWICMMWRRAQIFHHTNRDSPGFQALMLKNEYISPIVHGLIPGNPKESLS